VVEEVQHLHTMVSLVAAGVGVAVGAASLRHFRPPGVVFRDLNTRSSSCDIAFGVAAPDADAGWLDVKVRLRYRKVSQYLLNFMFGEESGLTAPITDLAVETVRIPVRRADPARGD